MRRSKKPEGDDRHLVKIASELVLACQQQAPEYATTIEKAVDAALRLACGFTPQKKVTKP